MDNYQILRNIGEGGMGEVYLAVDTETSKYAAIKVLPRHKAEDERLLRQFEKEAEISSLVSHPNIVTFLGRGEFDGHHYIALEYITGISLASLIKRKGALDPELALSVLQDISYGLLAVHQKGIVHRDIKPHNIMITADNTIKLIDFGIATWGASSPRAEEDEAGGVPDEDEDSLTSSSGAGGVIGTRVYAAPEQNQGKVVDTYSDIYSLGLVLYEMVGGKRLLKAGPLKQIIVQQLMMEKKLPPLSSLNPAIPKALDEIAFKMLKWDITERYKSAMELVADLESRLPELQQLDSSNKDLMKSKALAQLELAETYYWQAVNAYQEGRFIEALVKFDQLLTLQLACFSKYMESIAKVIFLLYWKLHMTFRGWTGGERPSAEIYLTILHKLANVLTKLNLNEYAPMLEKRISLILRYCEDDESRLKHLRRFFSTSNLFSDSIILMAEYVTLAEKKQLLAEYTGLLKPFAGNLEKQGFPESAEFIYSAYCEMKPEDEEAKRRHAFLQQKNSHMRKAAETLKERVRSLRKEGRLDEAIDYCRKHMKIHPEDAAAREELARLLQDAGRENEAVPVWRWLAVHSFMDDDMLASKTYLQKILRRKADDAAAIRYLAEILFWYDTKITAAESTREFTMEVFLKGGLPELAVHELEKNIHGTKSDLKTYRRMLEIAEEHRLDLDLPSIYGRMMICTIEHGLDKEAEFVFEEALNHGADGEDLCVRVGQKALELGRTADARKWFDRAIAISKDKKKLAVRLRGIKGINSIYSTFSRL